MTHKAYAWASGLIEFTSGAIPAGALPVAMHKSKKKLETAISVAARHGKGESDGKLIVPGIPEAEFTGDDPVICLAQFARNIANRLGQDTPINVQRLLDEMAISK